MSALAGPRARLAAAVTRATGPRANFTALLAGDLANKAMRLLATVLFARSLTLDAFGLLNVAIAGAGVVVAVTSLGLPEVGSRDVAVHPERAPSMGGLVLAVRLAAVGALALPALAVCAVLWPEHLGLVVAGVAMAAFMSLSADWLLRGLERMRALGLAWVAGGATMLAGSLLIAIASLESAALALAVFALGEAVISAASWSVARLFARPRFSLAGARKLLARSWPVGISGVIVYSYYANIDTIILAATRSNEEAGLYSAAYRTFLVFNTVAIFAAFALLPGLSRKVAEGAESESTERLLSALRLLGCYGAAVVGLAEIAGFKVLGLLFGAPFEAMDETFIVLCLAVAWYAVGYPSGYSLIAANRNRAFLLGAGVAGAINLALNILLIPPYGAIGAATATAVAFIAGSITWLHARALLGRRTAPMLTLLTLMSAGAAVAAAVPDLRLAIGLPTLIAGLMTGARVARDLRLV